jgi:hypothetical protein
VKYVVIGGPEKFRKELVSWDPKNFAIQVPSMTSPMALNTVMGTERYYPQALIVFGKDLIVWVHSSLNPSNEREISTAYIEGLTNELFKESWMQAPWTRA